MNPFDSFEHMIYVPRGPMTLRNICNHQNIECMHPAYNTVKEMIEREWTTYRSSPYNKSLEEYMREHMEWLVLTKVQYQIVLGKPMIVRRIYTKASNEMLYKRDRFPDLKVF